MTPNRSQSTATSARKVAAFLTKSGQSIACFLSDLACISWCFDLARETIWVPWLCSVYYIRNRGSIASKKYYQP